MAQINARVADEDKIKAEKVLKALGLSMSGYFASIVEYIADSGAIPFEIKQKPKLVSLDEVYTEAVNKFFDLYQGVLALRNSMQPGIEDQWERCRPLCNDHSLAIGFLSDNERYVFNAPCQVEKVNIGDGQVLDYSLSREKFIAVKSSLSAALRCANFNSRPLTQFDLDEMADSLAEAEKGLQSLLAMVPSERSESSQAAFFVMAARDTVHAARSLTDGPYELWSFTTWLSRLDAGCRDVLACQKRIGVSKWNTQVSKVASQLVTMKGEIDRWNQERLKYATLQNNYGWLSFSSDAIDIADEMVRTLQRSIARDGS